MDKPRENPALLGDERPTSPSADARTGETTKKHDAGSDADNTLDAMTESEEAVRHAAEDIPTDQDPARSIESEPDFDRVSVPPKTRARLKT